MCAEGLGTLLKRSWDPAISSQSAVRRLPLAKLPGNPVILVSPPGPADPRLISRRMRLWNNQLGCLGKVIGVVTIMPCDQCCESGSGIRCLFDPWIWDPGWVENQDPDPGSRSEMNNLDHISESLETIFWVKMLNFLDAIPDGKIGFGIRVGKKSNPGSGMEKSDPESGMENFFIWDKHPGSATLLVTIAPH